MYKIIAVGIGGSIGAIFRYLISGWSMKILGSAYPFGTLIVNILGGFLIGFIMETSIKTGSISPMVRIFLTTGMLGGLTTFSTFSYETIGMFSNSNYFIAVINILLNLSLSLLGVYLGKMIA